MVRNEICHLLWHFAIGNAIGTAMWLICSLSAVVVVMFCWEGAADVKCGDKEAGESIGQ